MNQVSQCPVVVERSALTRRQALAALVPLVFGGTSLPVRLDSAAQSADGILRRANIQHVNVRTEDIERSAEFYQRLFGFPAIRFVDPASFPGFALDFPHGGFISLMPRNPANAAASSSAVGTVDHFCIGIENYDDERTITALKAAGLNVTLASPSIILRDSNSSVGYIQISRPDEAFDAVSGLARQNVAGRLTSTQLVTTLAPSIARAGRGLFPRMDDAILRGVTLHHVSVRVTDVDQSVALFRRVFGFPQARRLEGSAVALDCADGTFLSLQTSTPTTFCLGVANFDSARAAAAIRGTGLGRDLQQQGNRIAVRDPAGLLIHVCDAADRFSA